jgi:hypothetical protein
VDAEEIEFRIASLRRELRLFEPIRGELVATVVHVLPAKNTELEHLRRSQLRAKFRIEVTPFRLCKPVDIALLHAVGHGDSTDAHQGTVQEVCALTRDSRWVNAVPPNPHAPNANADANIGATSEVAEKARFLPEMRVFRPFSST